jgi:elongation factor G
MMMTFKNQRLRGESVGDPIISKTSIAPTIMRVHKAVRAVASAEVSIGLVRNCASRPRFLCLNAATRGMGVRAAGRGQGAQRYFSESRSVRAGAAEAV